MLFIKSFIKKLIQINCKYSFPASSIVTEAVAQTCSVKKVFWLISQNSRETTCARVTFLIKCRPKACNFIRKQTLIQVLFCDFKKFQRTPFLQNTSGGCYLSYWVSTKGISNPLFFKFDIYINTWWELGLFGWVNQGNQQGSFPEYFFKESVTDIFLRKFLEYWPERITPKQRRKISHHHQECSKVRRDHYHVTIRNNDNYMTFPLWEKQLLLKHWVAQEKWKFVTKIQEKKISILFGRVNQRN